MRIGNSEWFESEVSLEDIDSYYLKTFTTQENRKFGYETVSITTWGALRNSDGNICKINQLVNECGLIAEGV